MKARAKVTRVQFHREKEWGYYCWLSAPRDDERVELCNAVDEHYLLGRAKSFWLCLGEKPPSKATKEHAVYALREILLPYDDGRGRRTVIEIEHEPGSRDNPCIFFAAFMRLLKQAYRDGKRYVWIELGA